ncbi:hypothetical protein COCC4DRAFT_127501 [Bipolaris maydis ATCC 48331]|uniref:Uncharacterized protein n=2 Tax=Cochliobolus heterostrophus TaxID=5016 RepID=M2UQL2_COCH5|nr:uncharacterized protein COCC4DRAFT_127501 [Bipolaris maydis ATCC 48331]EMD90197.1 hypothetical protein COCHEDRAFT_1178658 [Bipolaris maydis C5]ENI09591.1 hypothetical protein COCC4DRAFT_127501 [Bipolaris maydis ATCC 48331]KAJ5058099.1 hypothetical protein J3E74DRAFT_274800 [Bipolaris maydis]KAJ6206117.1 hypothetical protein PSV09DRAFT_1178658 [Bipolaris maydis]
MNATPQHLKVLLTGGARGIGRGLLRHLLTAGHEVIILDSNKEELDHVKTRAQEWSNGRKEHWHALHCDLSSRTQLKAAVNEVDQRFNGKLDVLINNAFPTHLSFSEDRSMEAQGEDREKEWDLQLAVGLTAPFLLSRLCVPLLAKGNSTPNSPGTIINVSSTRAYQAEPDHEAYSAVKAGLLGLTQAMCISLGHRHKIRVNAIIPGWIHVINESKAGDEKSMGWEEGLTEQDTAWHPAGRVGRVEDIAKAVEYAVSNEFVTGQEIVVDGGVGRKMVYCPHILGAYITYLKSELPSYEEIVIIEQNATSDKDPLWTTMVNHLCHERFKGLIPDADDFEEFLETHDRLKTAMETADAFFAGYAKRHANAGESERRQRRQQNEAEKRARIEREKRAVHSLKKKLGEAGSGLLTVTADEAEMLRGRTYTP